MFSFSNLNRYFLCHTDLQHRKKLPLPASIHYATVSVMQHINRYKKEAGFMENSMKDKLRDTNTKKILMKNIG